MSRGFRVLSPRAAVAACAVLASGLWLTPRSPAGPPQPPAPELPPAAVQKQLYRLEELRPQLGSDEWASALRDLIQLGPAAVPELAAEVDATKDEFALRYLAFALRGIGDKRAVPALIRALPRTCEFGRSDCTVKVEDKELLAFMQKHDAVDGNDDDSRYRLGRAVTEVGSALQRLTAARHGESEIVPVMLEGTPRQQYLQRSLYQRCAERWAGWWAAHWKEHVTDKRYARVDLPPLAEVPHTPGPFPYGPGARLGVRYSGHVLEPVGDPKAKRVFFDLDTGRRGELPKPLRVDAGEPERLDDTLAWAAREGFDLMGTEYRVPGDKTPHYVLRGLGLAAWPIDEGRWETLGAELREDKPLAKGDRTDGLLARFDPAACRYAAGETAVFLFETREGGHGVIFVGVEVHDTNAAAGVPVPRAPELSPVAFRKGRRFAYSLITGPDEVAKDAPAK